MVGPVPGNGLAFFPPHPLAEDVRRRAEGGAGRPGETEKAIACGGVMRPQPQAEVRPRACDVPSRREQRRRGYR
jgi:hypothetical protein